MSCGCEISVNETERKARVHIPVDKAIVSDIEAGDKIVITITGKVVGGRFSVKREDWEDSDGNLDIEVDNIEIEGRNVFQDIVD
jgi:hypothetical protein